MYEQKSINHSEIKIFSIKIIERILENIEVFDHEFIDDEEKQEVLESRTKITWKLFNIPVLKINGCTKQDEFPEKEFKFKLPSLNKLAKIILISLIAITILMSVFASGVFFSGSTWFNDNFYIKSHQMKNLEIKSLWELDKKLYKNDMSQYDYNVAYKERYELYHKYFEKVVERIKNLNLEEIEATPLFNYLDKYKERKETIEDILFPQSKMSIENDEYGTIYGSLYPIAMLEIDRQELLNYRMILNNMYDSNIIDDIDSIFED